MNWTALDTWIAITAALAGMSCALPGCFLVLRRQSLMGDALSHVTLPGIVLAYWVWAWLEQVGGFTAEQSVTLRQLTLIGGAVVMGIFTAIVTEAVGKFGRVEAGAALGVVFTSLFAFGLLLLRLTAKTAHLDAACVLYGNLETTVLETWPGTSMPRAAVWSAIGLLLACGVVYSLRKELCVSAFDPQFAEALGLRPTWLNYGQMGLTAAVVVIAFESVGSILVIAMLIIPPCAAGLLTQRYHRLLLLSMLLAGISGGLGHLLAITVPGPLFSALGYPQVHDASSAGMTAIAAGILFGLALLFGPRQGLIRRAMDRARLSVRIAMEDVLGLLFRLEEKHLEANSRFATRVVADSDGFSPWITWWAMRRLIRKGRVRLVPEGYMLTDTGRAAAREVVRSHRLWEVYMAKYFQLPQDHLHAAAANVEHFLNPTLRAELAAELAEPAIDPHGKSIPPES